MTLDPEMARLPQLHTMTELETPVPLAQQTWPQGTAPLLTICCATYNHVRFIRQALDGFLLQETTFPVEVLVWDDASTDGTSEVVREYHDRHPWLIRPLIQQTNQYSQGVRCAPLLRRLARGTFLATCEGDDFWRDPHKLQRQVDYLRAHPGVVLTFHDVACVTAEGVEWHPSQIAESGRLSQPRVLESFVQVRRALIPTLSIVFRKVAIPQPPEPLVTGDLFLFAMLTRHGQFHQLEPAMGCYRQHPGGVWSARSHAGRLDELVKTTRAIARCIHPAAAHEAALGLAFAAWRALTHALSSGQGDPANYLRHYLLAWLLVLRRPLAGGLASWLKYQCFILAIPPRHLWKKLKTEN